LALLPAVSVGTVAIAQRASGTSGNAQDRETADKTKAKTAKRAGNPMAITPAREAAALKFAELYHPELAHLLEGLKKRNRKAYRQAIRQLYLDSERLAKLKEGPNPKRYDIALQAWKLDSRIRLLAARVLLVKNPDPALEEQLKKALRERVDLRLQQMQLERDRLDKRLQKLNVDISALQDDRDAAVEQQLKRVKRSLGLRPRNAKGKRRKVNIRKTVPVKEKTR
jgi:hypothetical protein